MQAAVLGVGLGTGDSLFSRGYSLRARGSEEIPSMKGLGTRVRGLDPVVALIHKVLGMCEPAFLPYDKTLEGKKS